MNAFKKYLFSAAVVLAGLFAPSRAQAQFIVKDPANLAQAIANTLQQAMIHGVFNDVSTLTASAETYKHLEEMTKQLKDAIKALEKFSQGYQYGKQIYNISTDMVRQIENLNRMAQYIYASGASYTTATRALQIVRSYMSTTDMIYRNAKTAFNMVMSVRRGNGPELLVQMNEIMKQFEDEYMETTDMYTSRMYNIALEQLALEEGKRSQAFLNTVFY